MQRRTCLISVLAVEAVLLGRATARAQPPEDSGPRVEIGAQITQFLRSGPIGAGLRLTQARTNRFSVELEVNATRSRPQDDQINWYYAVQLKQGFDTLRRTGSGLFATYGVAGFVVRTYSPRGGQNSLVPPIFPFVGLGSQRVIARYAAVRGDAQVIVGYGETVAALPRLSASISIPIGGYRR